MFCRSRGYLHFFFLIMLSVDLWYLKTLEVLLVSCRTAIMHCATRSCFVQLQLPSLCSHSCLHYGELRISVLNALSTLNRALCKHFRYAHRARKASVGFFFLPPILSEPFLCILPISCVTLHFPCQIPGYFIVGFTFFLKFFQQLLAICSRNQACTKTMVLMQQPIYGFA